MAFHTDSIAKVDVTNTAKNTLVAPVGLFAASATLLTIGGGSIAMLAGIAVLASASLTYVGLVQPSGKQLENSYQFDLVYAGIAGLLFAIANGVAIGSIGLAGSAAMMATIGLFFALLVGEALLSAALSACSRVYSAPIAIAVSVNNRFFGLLGRAI